CAGSRCGGAGGGQDIPPARHGRAQRRPWRCGVARGRRPGRGQRRRAARVHPGRRAVCGRWARARRRAGRDPKHRVCVPKDPRPHRGRRGRAGGGCRALCAARGQVVRGRARAGVPAADRRQRKVRLFHAAPGIQHRRHVLQPVHAHGRRLPRRRVYPAPAPGKHRPRDHEGAAGQVV
ncbi:hypothetical protein IWQ56_005216, partial [Coemansia nantahalensis]